MKRKNNTNIQNRSFPKYLQDKDKLAIIKIWNSYVKKNVPFIGHGYYHHISVTNILCDFINEITAFDFKEDRLRLLMIASLLHDLGRSKHIDDNKKYIHSVIKDELVNYFETNEIDLILQFITSHNEIRRQQFPEEVLLYLADKMDYTISRAFLVQLYDKLFVEKTDGLKGIKDINLDKVADESMLKLKRNMQYLDNVKQKDIFEVLIDKIKNQYIHTTNTGLDLIQLFNNDFAQIKLTLKEFLLTEMRLEYKSALEMGFEGKKEALLKDYIMLATYNKGRLKSRLIKFLLVKKTT